MSTRAGRLSGGNYEYTVTI